MARSVSVRSSLPFWDQTVSRPGFNRNIDSTIQILANGGIVFALVGNDSVIGSSAKDFIDGSDDDDVIEGGGGADVLLGGAGDDTFLVRRPGDYPPLEVVDGGIWFDKLLLQGPDSIMVSALKKSVELISLGNMDTSSSTDNSDLIGTLLTYWAEFEGNNGSNMILGSLNNNVIRGGGGAVDTLLGLAGDATINGGAALSIIFGTHQSHRNYRILWVSSIRWPTAWVVAFRGR